jgi:hypothetical protein
MTKTIGSSSDSASPLNHTLSSKKHQEPLPENNFVCEIITINPFKTQGIPARELVRKFQTGSFIELLETSFRIQRPVKKVAVATTQPGKKTQANHLLEVEYRKSNFKTENPLLCPYKILETAIVNKLFNDFKEQQSVLINQMGHTLLPCNTNLLLWEHLSYCVLDQHPLNNDEKEALTYVLHEHWEEINWLFISTAPGRPSIMRNGSQER